jgi:hypothetical protein
MADMAKTLIILGLSIVCVGIVLYFLGKIPGAGKLPGDIMIKKENFTFYFPLTTCILISVVFSLILYFLGKK